MKILFCAIIGYLLGSLSPAAFFSKVKNQDLRQEGTGNLGATNTFLVLGKKYGVAVMLFDVAKAYISVKIGKLLAPTVAAAGIVAGGFAIVGHIFPFYMKFKGGKGLASFGGLILALDPVVFLQLFVIAVSLIFVVNYTVAAPISASILFPVMYSARHFDIASLLLLIAISILIITVHIPNIYRVKRGDDVKMREYVKKHLFG